MKTPLIALVAVLLLALPLTVEAQFNFTTNNGALTITAYTGYDNDVVIPATTNGYPVTSIGDYAFAGNSYGAPSFVLTSVTIPASITNLGDFAFYDCPSLVSVIIPDSVTSIGNYAFFGCPSLVSVIIPGSVTSIGNYAFGFCSGLTNVTIGNGVTSIGVRAFEGCSGLTSVTIGNGVTSIGVFAFASCTSLKSLYFQGNAPGLGSSVFQDVNASAVVYYLYGATGWAATYGGLPTALWNPTMQTTDGSFGVKNHQFGFNLTGTANIPILVEAATNLSQPSWTPLYTGTLTNGSLYFSDPNWTNYPRRFYRVRSP